MFPFQIAWQLYYNDYRETCDLNSQNPLPDNYGLFKDQFWNRMERKENLVDK